MLLKIKPRAKHAKSRKGSLTEEEKRLAKGLLSQGYQAQDITYIVNQGRDTTVNQARVSGLENDSGVSKASAKEVKEYLKIQSSYDPQTLLNPYKDGRLISAREAMMAAVQTFNCPLMTFKTELFCVMANIAWTYLLHEKMERTKKGSSKLPDGNSVSLNGTLGKDVCPIKDPAVVENLEKIAEIRNEVEHIFFVGGDECFGALFQACCVNFERYMTEWFGSHLSLAKELSLALQFGRLQKQQLVAIEASDFPQKIRAIYTDIQNNKHADDNAFQLTVYYSAEVSSKTSADLHKLVSYDDKGGEKVVIKKVAHEKITEKQLVAVIKKNGFKKFRAEDHRVFWRELWGDAKKRNRSPDAKKYGEVVVNSMWLWYKETWVPKVLEYCADNGDKFK